MRCSSKIIALCAIMIATLGCSNDPDSNVDPGIDMNVADMQSETDLQSGDSGGTDLGTDMGSGPGPDMALMNPEYCDPLAQNCVEPDASVCGLVFNPNRMPLLFLCRESLGDVGTGESCTQPDDVAGEDDCAAGNICHGYGLPDTEPRERVCRALCEPRTECEGEYHCIPLDSTGRVGMCVDSCDPGGNDCVEGSKCSVFFNAVESFWICTNDAEASVGTECRGSEQCGEGQFCPWNTNPAVRTCEAFCADDLRCTDGGACAPSTVTPVGYGICEEVDWSCAGTPWPAVSAADSDVTVTVSAAGAAVPNATVNACAADDTDCAAPIASGTTDAGGNVTVNVPTGTAGFDGYFEVTADGYLTELLYAEAPIGQANATVTATLTAGGTADQPFAWTGNVMLDAARGHIASVIDPCTTSGGGAQVTVTSSLADASTTTGYVSEISGTSLFDSTYTSTTINGRAAMANHPAGAATLTYTNSEGVVVATRQVVVRPGALTFVWVVPTP